MTFASGSHYVGGWREGKKHGAGVMTCAGGGVLDGAFDGGTFVVPPTGADRDDSAPSAPRMVNNKYF